MKPSEVIRMAAMTARMLGYTVFRPDSLGGCKFVYVIHRGIEVTKFFTNVLSRLPTEEQALGHFLVRLHMEGIYGIKTDHYWEDKDNV